VTAAKTIQRKTTRAGPVQSLSAFMADILSSADARFDAAGGAALRDRGADRALEIR